MTAILQLIPLDIEECRKYLGNIGKPTANDTANILLSHPKKWLEECNRQRNPITLKLCSISDDIIELDDDDDDDTIESGIVKYATQYQDGRFASVVSLGRNPSTGITWGAVSRALCDVSLAMNDNTKGGSLNDCITNGSNSVTASLTMRKTPGTHAVYLDGDLIKTPLGCEIQLKHGSIISLLLRTGFAYQVHMLENNDNNNDAVIVPAAAAAAAAPAAALTRVEQSPVKRQKVDHSPPPPQTKNETTTARRQRIRDRAHKTMESEFTCAMCMDVLVKSTFAVPCSHAFCEECSLSVTSSRAISSSSTATIHCANEGGGNPPNNSKGQCPTCRGNVEAWMPARSYDAVVWSFALQGFLDSSDAEYYLERREEAGEDPPTEDERGSILNIAKNEEELELKK